MTVKVLFFGELKEQLGKTEDFLQVQSNESLRVCDVLGRFMQGRERQRSWHGHLLYAVNHEQVADDYWIRDGDEVALMPPMTGG